MELILLDSSNVPLKSRHDKISWCLDSNGELKLLITPKLAWAKVDSETSWYSQQYQLPVAAICFDITTQYPNLKPAFIPLSVFSELKQTAESVAKYLEIPPSVRKHVTEIFSAIKLPEKPDDPLLIGAYLRRIGKSKLERGERFTRSEYSGERIDIFHTCLWDDKPKPYSFAESYTLKLKGWFRR